MTTKIHSQAQIHVEAPEVAAGQGTTNTGNAAPASNSVGEHNGSTPSAPPPETARETVARRHAEINEMTEERLQEDPDYVKLKAKEQAWGDITRIFSLIDNNTLWAGDNKVSLDDLKALASDPLRPQSARDAAQLLLDNPEIWAELATGLDGTNDNLVGAADIQRFKDRMTGGLSAMREKVKSEVMGEMAAEQAATPRTQAGGGSTSGGTTTTPTTSSSGQSVESQVPRPTPSTLPGMDGVSENLANTAEYLQKQMMALADEASKNPDQASVIGQKIAMLQNKFQAITNMMNQLTQMISNMSKMWSDVAMNSIRNLK